MPHSFKALKTFSIEARDGDIGKVADLFFDDQNWSVRYVVVDTGTWLPGRLVLVQPPAFLPPDLKERALPVQLTREQLKTGPGIGSDLPVSRQLSDATAMPHLLPDYLPGLPGAGGGAANAVAASRAATSAPSESAGNPHLRSVKEIIGYRVDARDGKMGHIEDVVVETESWDLHYFIIDTKNWLPGKKVMVAPAWTEQIDWEEQRVGFDLTQDVIKGAPEFDPTAPINRNQEERLYDYYGRPRPW